MIVLPAGAHEVIARLPRGYETILGKWFAEGTNFDQSIAPERTHLGVRQHSTTGSCSRHSTNRNDQSIKNLPLLPIG